MKGFSISVGLITGCCVGIEFPESNLLVLDFLIVRVYIEWFDEGGAV